MAEIYLAATFSRAEEMREYREQLAKEGHSVRARWIDSHEKMFGVMKSEEVMRHPEKARQSAQEDIADILTCDIVILFTDMPSTTGGRHTEFGMALAFGKKIVIVGQRENIFQAAKGISQYNTWEDMIKMVRRANASRKTWSSETSLS